MCGSVLFVHSLSGKTLANHVSNNTHYCGTSVIKFDIQLTGLLFWVLNLSSEPTYTVVTIVLRRRYPREFDEGAERDDLCGTNN